MDRGKGEGKEIFRSPLLLRLASVNVLLGTGLNEVPPAVRPLLNILLKGRKTMKEGHTEETEERRGKIKRVEKTKRKIS